jgi:hypothetical protein
MNLVDGEDVESRLKSPERPGVVWWRKTKAGVFGASWAMMSAASASPKASSEERVWTGAVRAL